MEKRLQSGTLGKAPCVWGCDYINFLLVPNKNLNQYYKILSQICMIIFFQKRLCRTHQFDVDTPRPPFINPKNLCDGAFDNQ